jgi:hypothetical protein
LKDVRRIEGKRKVFLGMTGSVWCFYGKGKRRQKKPLLPDLSLNATQSGYP